MSLKSPPRTPSTFTQVSVPWPPVRLEVPVARSISTAEVAAEAAPRDEALADALAALALGDALHLDRAAMIAEMLDRLGDQHGALLPSAVLAHQRHERRLARVGVLGAVDLLQLGGDGPAEAARASGVVSSRASKKSS